MSEENRGTCEGELCEFERYDTDLFENAWNEEVRSEKPQNEKGRYAKASNRADPYGRVIFSAECYRYDTGKTEVCRPEGRTAGRKNSNGKNSGSREEENAAERLGKTETGTVWSCLIKHFREDDWRWLFSAAGAEEKTKKLETLLTILFETDPKDLSELENAIYDFGSLLTDKDYLGREIFMYMVQMLQSAKFSSL